MAKIHALPASPVSVRASGNRAAVDALRAAWDGSKNIILVDETHSSAWAAIEIVATENGHFIISDAASGRTFSEIPAVSGRLETRIEIVKAHLNKIVRWMRTIDLDNPASQLHHQVGFELETIDKNKTRNHYKGKEIKHYISSEHLWEGKIGIRLWAMLKTSRQDLYFYAFGLEDNCSIRFMNDEEKVVRADKIRVDRPFLLNAEFSGWELRDGEIESIRWFKLFVTTEEVDHYQLAQHGLNASRGTASDSDKPSFISGDWCAVTMKVKMVRQDVKIGTDDVHIGRGKVRIKSHGAVNAQVGLMTAEVGSKSSDPSNKLAMLARHGLQMVPLDGGDPKAPGRHVLELTDLSIKAPVSLAEHPLEIVIPGVLSHNEMLLPIAFDGQYFRVIGDAEVQGGETVVNIRDLPMPRQATGQEGELVDHPFGEAPEDRSLFKALKVAFFKTKLKKNPQNPLSWIDFKPDGTVERRVDVGTLNIRVSTARRILLVIHGLIGDAESMAQSLASITGPGRQRVQDAFDLVLAYDYDNLKTPIEDTALQLKTDLGKAGIKAGDGKHVTVLAHSLGGLMSRWWIEREGGHEIVDHLILAGTPNHGMRFDRLEGALAFAAATLDFTINLMPSLIPFAGSLFHTMKGAVRLVGPLEQMRPGSDFLSQLNRSVDPKVRYSIVAGDITQGEDEGKGWREWVQHLESRRGGSVQGDGQHDLAASVESMLNASGWQNRNPQPSVLRLACHHLNYLTSKAGRDALGALMRPEKQTAPALDQGALPVSLAAPVNRRSELLGFPKSYAFIIGINEYPKINAPLISAVPDAERLAWVLKERQGFDHVHLLKNATKAQIMDLLAQLQDASQAPRITKEDSLVFYYAGHGKAGEFDQGPVGYLLPSDAQPRSAALRNDSLVRMGDVFEALSTLDCQHTLLIFDCCFAGQFRYVGQRSRDVGNQFFMPLYEERFERYKRKKAWQVLVSAGPDETAADWMGERSSLEQSDHSPFAHALLEALEGSADVKPRNKNLGDGVLTIQELFLYLWDNVEKKTRDDDGVKTQYPDLFPMGKHDGGQFIFFDPNHKLNFAKRDERNPYRGLYPYAEDDASLFFGREAAVRELHGKIMRKDTPLLVVSGPSGIGKSSLVQAGLWPLLKKKEAFETCWVLRPGGDLRLLFEGLSGVDAGKRQLLVIDQYEEWFTEREAVEKARFESEIIQIWRQARQGQLKIILTLRSDFEWHLQTSDFGHAFWQSANVSAFLYHLVPMNLDELREAIVNPAWVEAYDFESPELVDTILQDVSHAPGALPLLSFTMGAFYHVTDKDKRIFTAADYRDELGGVYGALSKRADDLFHSLPDDVQPQTMRSIMLRMVRLNDGQYTRRRVYYGHRDKSEGSADLSHELDYPFDDQDQQVRKVIQILADAQLVLQGGQGAGLVYVEPAHDALINNWPQCKQWIEEFGHENLLLQRELWRAVREYHRNHQEDRFLWYTNPKLQQLLVAVLDPEDRWLRQQTEGHEELSTLAFLLWEPNPTAEQLKHLIPWERFFLVPGKVLQEPEWERYGYDLNAYRSDELQVLTLHDLHVRVMSQADLWFNQNEQQFIRASFERQWRQIEELRQQRDEALRMHALMLSEKAKQEYDHNRFFDAARMAVEALPKSMAEPDRPYVPEAEVELYRAIQNLPESVVLKGHDRRVTFGAYSRDGQHVVTASHDGTARIWEVQTGQSVSTLTGHEARVTHAAFHPDGKQVATASEDGTARIWDVDTGEELTVLSLSDEVAEGYYHVAFSPDGKRLATASSNDGAVLWNAETWNRIAHLEGPNIPAHAIFSPDPEGCLIVATDRFYANVYIWDGHTGEHRATAEGHTAGHYYATFSPCGKYLVSASADHTARLWIIEMEPDSELPEPPPGELALPEPPPGELELPEPPPGELALPEPPPGELELPEPPGSTMPGFEANALPFGQRVEGKRSPNITIKAGPVLDGHSAKVFHADFSPDSQYVITASQDKTARLWDVETGKLLASLDGHVDEVRHAAFSSDSKLVVTASRDGSAIVWDVSSGKSLCGLGGHTGGVTHAVFKPNERQVLTTGDTTARLHPLAGNLALALHEHYGPIHAVAFSPDGKYVATGSGSIYGDEGDNTIRFWTVNEGELVDFCEGHTIGIQVLAFSRDGRRLLSSTGEHPVDDTTRLWDVRTHEMGSFEGQMADWDLGAQEVRSFKGQMADWDPDGREVVTVSNGCLLLWEEQGAEPTILHSFPNISRVIFSPNKQYLAVACGSWTGGGFAAGGVLVDVAERRQIVLPTDDGWATKSFHFATFSSDSQYAAAAGQLEDSYCVWIWNTKRAELIHVLKGHEEEVNDAAFSPDGQLIVTVSGAYGTGFVEANRIRLWNASTGHLIKTWTHSAVVTQVIFSHDGKQFVTVSEDDSARLWDVAQGATIAIFQHPRIHTAVFSPNSRKLVTVSGDGYSEASENYACIWTLFPDTQTLLQEARNRLHLP